MVLSDFVSLPICSRSLKAKTKGTEAERIPNYVTTIERDWTEAREWNNVLETMKMDEKERLRWMQKIIRVTTQTYRMSQRKKDKDEKYTEREKMKKESDRERESDPERDIIYLIQIAFAPYSSSLSSFHRRCRRRLWHWQTVFICRGRRMKHFRAILPNSVRKIRSLIITTPVTAWMSGKHNIEKMFSAQKSNLIIPLPPYVVAFNGTRMSLRNHSQQQSNLQHNVLCTL